MMITAFLLFLLWIIASIFFATIKSGISPMPSSHKAIKKIMKVIPVGFNGKIIDLGSGWGSIIFAAAAKFPLSKVEGYEISTVPYVFCRLLQFFRRERNVKIYKRDFFSVPLHDAAIIICYLYPVAMDKLKEKFEKELRPGTLIVSNTFAIPGWMPQEIIPVDDLYKTNVYVYVK